MRLQITFGGDGEALFGPFARVFAQAFGRGQHLSVPAEGFAGRVLRGTSDDAFTSLSDNPHRQIVFLLDSDGLASLIGLSGVEILRHIGYADDTIRDLVERGTRFKLVLIPSATLKPATWDNLFALVGEVYPEWRERIERAAPRLCDLTYDEALAEGGEVAEVRRFLHDEINVNSLFAGDGFTRHPDNPDEPVCAEYLVLNQPLEAFGSYCLIEFPVSAP
jgi:hypothetical protein